jgi:hypothetical protein
MWAEADLTHDKENSTGFDEPAESEQGSGIFDARASPAGMRQSSLQGRIDGVIDVEDPSKNRGARAARACPAIFDHDK